MSRHPSFESKLPPGGQRGHRYTRPHQRRGSERSSSPIWRSTSATSLSQEYEDYSSSSGMSDDSDFESDTSSMMWDRMESDRMRDKERVDDRDVKNKQRSKSNTPLVTLKRIRRELHVRRGAQVLVGVLALVTLMYLATGENYKLIFDMLPDSGFFKGLFAHGIKGDNDGLEQQRKEDEENTQLIFRTLPQGGSVTEVITAPTSGFGQDTNLKKIIPTPTPPQHRQHTSKINTLRERNRMEHLKSDRWDAP